MKATLISALCTVGLFECMAVPALAQDTVTGAPANQEPVTVQGYHGYGSPAYRPSWGSRHGYGPVRHASHRMHYYPYHYGYYRSWPVNVVGEAADGVVIAGATALGALDCAVSLGHWCP
jgi:hypothetical protein